MPKRADLKGKRFGRLVAICFTGRKDNRCNGFWRCMCNCGKVHTVLSTALKAGSTKSCGCLNSELSALRLLKHGHARHKKITPEWRAWSHMKGRCLNKNDNRWKDYGGRGIKVCWRWRSKRGFENFLADMGLRPKGRTLHRTHNDGNYEPRNCKWATASEQAFNRRKKRTK